MSSALWGTSDFLGGLVSRRRPALAVVGVSQFFGLLVMLFVATVSGSWGANTGYVPWAIFASACGITGLYTFYVALATGTMGIVAPIAACGVIVPVIVGLIGGDVPTGIQAIGIAFAVVGVVLATGPELSGDGNARSVLLAGISGVLFGLVFVALARGGEFSSIMTVTAMRITSVTVLAVVALAFRSVGGISRPDLPVLFVAGAFDALANVALGAAAHGDNLTIASVLGSFYPIVTILLAWWFLNERLRRIQYIGIAAAMVGVITISAGALS